MSKIRARLQLLLTLVAVGVLSWFAREAQHRRVDVPGHGGWVTTDPDSLYQMRRVERVLRDGLPVAERDERLDFPHGSAVPWPPYYTLTLSALLAPFAPRDATELHNWIEMRVASLPLWFSVCGSLLAALAARRIAGNFGAWIAGSLHALCGAAVAYGRSGNGDHHAFVSLLAGAMLLVATFAFENEALADKRRSWRLGALLGALAGFAMGVWVAALLYVVIVQFVLFALLADRRSEPRAGLGALGLAFHTAALVAAFPAIWTSPWRTEQPWIVVNLSWFHATYLAFGALLFVPLVVSRGDARVARAWPWIVATLVFAVTLLLAFSDGGMARGVRESLRWVTRNDAFMAQVGESRPLLGAGTGAAIFEALGYGVVVLPFAWIAGARVVIGRREWRLLPWVVAVAVLASLAARQARFAESLSIPFAVLIAWSIVHALESRRLAWMRRVPSVVLAMLAIAFVAFAQWPCTQRSIERWRHAGDANQRELPSKLGVRMACEWLFRNAPRERVEGVLADWSFGHAIEWAAALPSVATNFGAYVGGDGFRAPARFFLEEDPDVAGALLAERRVRFVIVDSDLPNRLNDLIPLAASERRERYVGANSEHGGQVQPAWFLTLGARLMFEGGVFGPLGRDTRPLNRLRIVWISPLPDPGRRLRSASDVSPAAWIWERVEGAVVEARGAPGDELALQVRMRFPKASREFMWSDRALADADGLARLVVPYATDAANGDGRADGDARWTFAARRGTLVIPEQAVRDGSVLRLDPK